MYTLHNAFLLFILNSQMIIIQFLFYFFCKSKFSPKSSNLRKSSNLPWVSSSCFLCTKGNFCCSFYLMRHSLSCQKQIHVVILQLQCSSGITLLMFNWKNSLRTFLFSLIQSNSNLVVHLLQNISKFENASFFVAKFSLLLSQKRNHLL